MNKAITSFLFGIVFGYKGLSIVTHLVYLAIILTLAGVLVVR